MASDIWLKTILIVRKETRCRHIGYSYRLTARVLLYAPSHRQDNTYHSLYYTSRGALAGMRNSSMGPPHEGSIRRPIALTTVRWVVGSILHITTKYNSDTFGHFLICFYNCTIMTMHITVITCCFHHIFMIIVIVLSCFICCVADGRNSQWSGCFAGSPIG